MPRFNILKHKNFLGLYAIFDNEQQAVVATADTMREAQNLVIEMNQLILQDQIIDEAMNKLFGT